MTFTFHASPHSLQTNPHSLEDPGTSDPEESRDEPNTFQESYDDINVDHLLNNLQLVGTDTHLHCYTCNLHWHIALPNLNL